MQKFEKHFLRACINQSCMSIEKAGRILIAICDHYGVETPDIRSIVNGLNASLSPYNQGLTFFKHPLCDSTEFLVFAITFESDAGKNQMHYTDADRHFFLKLMAETVKSVDYSIPWNNIYNVVEVTSKKLSKQKIQDLAQKWIQQGYYIERDEKLYFGPRMIVEYRNHLKRNYSDYITDCLLCSKVVLWDIECKECNTKLHRDCLRNYLARKSVCPSCKKTWNTSLNT